MNGVRTAEMELGQTGAGSPGDMVNCSPPGPGTESTEVGWGGKRRRK